MADEMMVALTQASDLMARNGAETLKVLRGSGRALHEELDGRFGALDLNNPNEYADFLRCHEIVLRAVEPILRLDAEMPVWRPRLSLVEADLRALGEERERAALTTEADLLTALASHGGRLGAVYVLEGSRLGGRFLAGKIADPKVPKSYLAAGHAQGGWATFLAALGEALGRETDGGSAACAGAGAVFRAFLAAA